MARGTGSARRPDPTAVMAQRALRSASGTAWLWWGALTAAVVAAVLVAMAVLEPRVGWTCFAVVVVAYIAMIVVRFAVRPRRPRLVTLAVLDGVIVATGLVGVITVLAVE